MFGAFWIGTIPGFNRGRKRSVKCSDNRPRVHCRLVRMFFSYTGPIQDLGVNVRQPRLEPRFGGEVHISNMFQEQRQHVARPRAHLPGWSPTRVRSPMFCTVRIVVQRPAATTRQNDPSADRSRTALAAHDRSYHSFHRGVRRSPEGGSRCMRGQGFEAPRGAGQLRIQQVDC